MSDKKIDALTASPLRYGHSHDAVGDGGGRIDRCQRAHPLLPRISVEGRGHGADVAAETGYILIEKWVFRIAKILFIS